MMMTMKKTFNGIHASALTLILTVLTRGSNTTDLSTAAKVRALTIIISCHDTFMIAATTTAHRHPNIIINLKQSTPSNQTLTSKTCVFWTSIAGAGAVPGEGA